MAQARRLSTTPVGQGPADRGRGAQMAGSAPPTPPPGVMGASPDTAPAPSQTQHAGGGGKGRLVALTAGWVVVVLVAGVWAIGTTVDPAEDEVAAPGASQGAATGFGALTDDADADGPVGFSALADDAGQRSEDATGNTQDARGFSSIDPGRAGESVEEAHSNPDGDPAPDGAPDSDDGLRTNIPDGPITDQLDLAPLEVGYSRFLHGSHGFVIDLPRGWELVSVEEGRFVYGGEDATVFAADNVIVEREPGVADGIDDMSALRAHHERTLEPFDEVELLDESDDQVRTFALGERRVYEATTYRTRDVHRGEFMARTRILVATGGDVISVTYTSHVDLFSENLSVTQVAFDSFEVAW